MSGDGGGSLAGRPASLRAPPRRTADDDAEDLALIRAVAQQDCRALGALYRRYAPRLGRFLARVLGHRDCVGEVVNDVMLVAYQKAASFDPARARLSTWLFGIAHNKALNALARSTPAASRARDDDRDDDEPQRVAGGADRHTPEGLCSARQLGEALQWALGRLSFEHREVVELTFIEGRAYAEIAAITGCPVNTVKTRMFHARRHLGELLASRGIDDFVIKVRPKT